MTMRIEELVQRLQRLGCTGQEAIVFLKLLGAGTLPAGRLAAEAGLARTRTYKVLEDLVQRDWVERLPGKPVQYRTIDPDELFTRRLRDHELAWEEMVKTREEILGPLVHMAARRGAGQGPDRLRLLTGRPQIVQAIGSLALRARQELHLVAAGPDGVLLPGVGETVEAAVRRALQGVKVRIHGDAAARRAVRALAGDDARLALRLWSAPRPALVALADRGDLVTVVRFDPALSRRAEHDVAISTTSPAFTALQATLLERAWEASAPEVAPTATPGTP